MRITRVISFIMCPFIHTPTNIHLALSFYVLYFNALNLFSRALLRVVTVIYFINQCFSISCSAEIQVTLVQLLSKHTEFECVEWQARRFAYLSLPSFILECL